MVLWWPVAAFSQVDTVAADTLPATAIPDSLALAADTLQGAAPEPLFQVTPWDYHAPLGATLTATDSSLRWQIWPSWTYKKNRDPGVITTRMGTIGRTNAMLLDAHEPKYQQLYWGNILLNDPVTGLVNWNYMPHHRIKKLYQEQLGTFHQTRFYVKEYYLNEPLTQLNYEESSFDTRSLEFVVSRNFGQKTNAEISYWDRRDGGGYENSAVKGRQIYARVSHQLSHSRELRFHFLNNNFDNSLPFGYIIPQDPTAFSFDRFVAVPNEGSALAERSNSLFSLNFYQRPSDSTSTTSTFHAGIYTNNVRRNVDYSEEETAYQVRELGATVRKWVAWGPLKAEAGGSYSYFLNQKDSVLQTGNWGLMKTDAALILEPADFMQLEGYGNYHQRSDGFSEYTLGARAGFSVGRFLSLSGGYSVGSQMPTPQQLYWQSQIYQGAEQLSEEKLASVYGDLIARPFSSLAVGARGHVKQIENGIWVNSDSSFANMNTYSSISLTGFFDLHLPHFELSGSATMQQFGNFWNASSSQPLPVDKSERIWFKGSAYVKGYLFDRATFVKAGLAGMFAPQAYPPLKYYPALDYWQSSGAEVIPSFSSLDVDISARVRTIMVLLRYENVLDDVTQQGYFETAGYPMPGRRFIFGVRVLFRN